MQSNNEIGVRIGIKMRQTNVDSSSTKTVLILHQIEFKFVYKYKHLSSNNLPIYVSNFRIHWTVVSISL